MKTILVHLDDVVSPDSYNLAIIAPPETPGVMLNFTFDDRNPSSHFAMCPEMAQSLYESLAQALQTIKDLNARN